MVDLRGYPAPVAPGQGQSPMPSYFDERQRINRLDPGTQSVWPGMQSPSPVGRQSVQAPRQSPYRPDPRGIPQTPGSGPNSGGYPGSPSSGPGGYTATPGWYSGGGYFAGGPQQSPPPGTGELQIPSPRSPGYNQNIGPSLIAFGNGVNPNANYGQSWQNYTNPYDMMYNQYIGANYGPQQQAIWNQIGGNLDTFGNNYRNYNSIADAMYGYDNYGKNAYYTPDEINNMIREGGFMGGMTTPEEFANTYFTDQERQNIAGNPYAGLNYFNDRVGNMYSDLDTQEGRTFDALGNLDTRLDRVGDAYSQAGSGALTEGATNLRGITADPRLGLSDEFGNRYNFGQADMTDLENLAGSTAGSQIRSQYDDIERRAAAEGNTSPLALAALKDRTSRDAASAASDAATAARVQGKGLQLQTLANKENLRLGAAQNQADKQAAAESNILSGRLGFGQSLAGLQSGNQQFASGARLNAYNQLGNQRQGTNQFVAGMGGQFASAGDTSASNRAGMMANQRANMQASNNAIRFGQNFDTQSRLAQGYNNVANQRLGANQEQRGYFAGQAAANQGALQNATNAAANYWTNWNNAGQNAANSYGSYDLNRRNQYLQGQQAQWNRQWQGPTFNLGGK